MNRTMDVKEKLAELIFDSINLNTHTHRACNLSTAVADDLIANGVTVQGLDGCEYCKHSESIYHHSSGIHDSMDEDVYISGNNIVVDIGCHSYGTEEIKFCPMCGRKLPHPPKGE